MAATKTAKTKIMNANDPSTYLRSSRIVSLLRKAVMDANIVETVYKYSRPQNIVDNKKISNFAVVVNSSRVRGLAVNGGGPGDTICRIEVYARAVNGVYPDVLDSLEEKMLELLPIKTNGVIFDRMSVIPAVYDGVGFYCLFINLNTIILPITE